jgi:hypothetical protein
MVNIMSKIWYGIMTPGLKNPKLCPISGRIIDNACLTGYYLSMSDPADLSDLVGYLARTSNLTTAQITRLVDEVLAFLEESAEEFICRRHRELRHEGHPNAKIFSRICEEVMSRRFRAPAYTERQIRRIIYG